MDAFIKQNHFNSGKISLLYVDAGNLVAHKTFCDDPLLKAVSVPNSNGN
ncbi:Uncharacterised protein [Chryseobacterium taklimakanense]|uniref:Uncharacterized protein n=1 Tax=Chryseobacterium taklimakanense TaxID=536441 RepID=A0A239XNS4_9FLAO|nr:hypothetical protein [Chryseobacterium taklimakanense]SNV48561.1 Uncharacterised protein [Chryseobacterium taklimakanense]